MIDLEKEYEKFEAYMNRDEREKDDVFVAESNGWVARAMFENEEIERLSSKYGSAIGKLHFTEKKLGEAQQEVEATKRELEFATKTINNLLEKLAKYESDKFVFVSRVPTQVMLDAFPEFENNDTHIEDSYILYWMKKLLEDTKK